MEAEAPLFELFTEIAIIDQLAGTLLERRLPAGMTRAQFAVLNHFVRLGGGPFSPTQLADALQVTRPTMTSTLGRMIRAGYLEMAVDPDDRRTRRITITVTGRAARETAIKAVATVFPLIEAAVAETPILTATPLLRTLRVALDRLRDRAGEAG